MMLTPKCIKVVTLIQPVVYPVKFSEILMYGSVPTVLKGPLEPLARHSSCAPLSKMVHFLPGAWLPKSTRTTEGNSAAANRAVIKRLL